MIYVGTFQLIYVCSWFASYIIESSLLTPCACGVMPWVVWPHHTRIVSILFSEGAGEVGPVREFIHNHIHTHTHQNNVPLIV